jgi:DNA-directed RNA polymerase specialized sigma24 family protein
MTKEQLRQYRSIRIETSQIARRIEELEQMCNRCDRELLQPLQDLYRGKLEELLVSQMRIEKAIEGLNPTERELMRLRYIDGAEWIDIAETIHYEWAQTHRVHARALAKIKNL